MHEVINWEVDPINKLFVLTYDKDGEEAPVVFSRSRMTDALIECGVFESFNKGAFTHTVESPTEHAAIIQDHTVTTTIEDFFENFIHFVDGNKMKQILNWYLNQKQC